MLFLMLYSAEHILSFKPCFLFYPGDSLKDVLKNAGHLENFENLTCQIAVHC